MTNSNSNSNSNSNKPEPEWVKTSTREDLEKIEEPLYCNECYTNDDCSQHGWGWWKYEDARSAQKELELRRNKGQG